MSRAGLAALLLAAAAVGGCVEGGGPAQDGAGAEGSPLQPEVPAGRMLLTGCVAFEAFRNYPASLAPGSRPDGWPADPPEDIASVSVLALRCERLALAGYERGPVHILSDSHGNAAVPPECAKGQAGVTKLRVLNHLVVDDPGVGAELQARHGVPVLLASFTERDGALGGGLSHQWSWALDGQAPSVVTVLDPGQDAPKSTLIHRLFWQAGQGLGSLELRIESRGAATNLAANGTLQPPMLLASDTGGRFAGQGDWFEDVHAEGAFASYDDLGCLEPR